MQIMYTKETSGSWYEKIKGKESPVKSQMRLDSVMDKYIDEAIEHPGVWIEVELKPKKIKVAK